MFAVQAMCNTGQVLLAHQALAKPPHAPVIVARTAPEPAVYRQTLIQMSIIAEAADMSVVRATTPMHQHLSVFQANAKQQRAAVIIARSTEAVYRQT